MRRQYADRLDAHGVELLSEIETSAKRMQALVGDLLTHSQVTHGASDPGPVDCTEALASAMENCGVAIADTRAEISSGPLPVVLGDRTEIVLLFQNLISNAVKYRGKAQPVIRISAHEDQGIATFQISDNGMGIPAQYHERIFGLFKRLHGREIPGTGMGLALVRRIVEKRGGRVWVESEVGRGSTFFFTLPVARAAKFSAAGE
jgi:light-regulated signal transduction histidine kinase (bacteriophytochrome)